MYNKPEIEENRGWEIRNRRKLQIHKMSIDKNKVT